MQTITTNPMAFLAGSGEMIRLIHEKDWSQTAVGSPHTWPQSLRTTLSIILQSRFPMFLFWGPELVCFYNDAYRPSLGNDGKHPAALGERGQTVWPEIWPIIKPLIDQVLSGGEATWSEDQLVPIYRNGHIEDVYWTFSYSPVNDESGQVAGVFVTCTETTQAVISRRRQEESTRQLVNLLEQAPTAIGMFYGPQFIIEVANPIVCRMWGRTQAQVLNRPLFEALPEAAGQGFEELLREVLETGKPFVGYELPVTLQRNGVLETAYFDFTYHPYVDVDGRISRIILVADEVTDAVLARRQMKETEHQFQQLADLVPQIIWTARPDGYLDYYNQRWYDYTGFDKASGGDASWVPILHPDDVDKCLNTWYNAVRTGQPYQIEYRFVDPQNPGQYRWFMGRALPVRSANGEITRWFGTCTDIHDQKTLSEQLEKLVAERTEALQRANDDLARSNLDLIQFASVASHDLKEPLRKVQTFGSRLQDMLASRMNAEETDLFNRLINSTARMNTLVNDVLRLSKLSDQTVAYEPVDLNRIFDRLREDLELTIREQRAELHYEHLPTVQAEPGQMHQLFLNLISNALKFQNSHPEGHRPQIRIALEPLTRQWAESLNLPSQQYALISVRDNGIGFESKYKDRIFGMFQRLHGRSQYAGTGIGLTIVKKIVDNHRGGIDVESEPGRGTTFFVALPLSVPGDTP